MTFGQPVVPRLHASISRAFGLSDRVEGEAPTLRFSIRSNQYRAYPKGQRIYGSQQKLGVTPVLGAASDGLTCRGWSGMSHKPTSSTHKPNRRATPSFRGGGR